MVTMSLFSVRSDIGIQNNWNCQLSMMDKGESPSFKILKTSTCNIVTGKVEVPYVLSSLVIDGTI